MRELDLVNITSVNPRIITDIRYATSNNFTGQVLYSHALCFLRKEVALKLSRIHDKFEQQGLGIKVFDGYRPRSVQYILWDLVSDRRFIADPKVGSKHNRGAAVDVTLVDSKGNELIMPTPFDDFTEKAFSDCMDLPEEAIANRTLLHQAMREGGFLPLPTEWWHFDDCDWQNYPLEDLSFDCLVNSYE